MNLPNALTVLRLVITAILVAVLALPMPRAATAALLLFLAAALTDYLDGAIARRHNLITDFGRLMDPLADKILTVSAFVCLIPAIPAWAVITIIAREFLITGLRLLAGTKGVVLPAERLGKHKTAWQMITIVFYLLLGALREWSPNAAYDALGREWIGPVLLAITVALTVYSGGAYFWRHRDLIQAG